jgi:hypothetical protein
LFESNGTIIGSPVTLDATGKASATTTFPTAGTRSLTAVFTATGGLQGSTSPALIEQVIPAGGMALQVAVAQTGMFSLTAASPTVALTSTAATPLVATGTMSQIEVSDTRNTFPGWNITGQVTDFTAPARGSLPASDIPGNQLGWVPIGTVQGGAVLGGAIIPASPGLSSAATLASAAPGSGQGTSTLGANLTLNIPPTTVVGQFTAALTLTAVGTRL